MLRPLIWPTDETIDQKRIRYLEDRVNFLEQNARVRFGNTDSIVHDDLGELTMDMPTHTHNEVDVIETHYLVVDQFGKGDFVSIQLAINYIVENGPGDSWTVRVRKGTYAEGLTLTGVNGVVTFVADGVVTVAPSTVTATITGTSGGNAVITFIGFAISQTDAGGAGITDTNIYMFGGVTIFRECTLQRSIGSARAVVRAGKVRFYHCTFTESGVGESTISFTGDSSLTDAGDYILAYQCLFEGQTSVGIPVVENWVAQQITLYNCRITNTGTGDSIQSNTASGGVVAVGRCLYNTAGVSGTLTVLDGDNAGSLAPSPHDIVGSHHTVTGSIYQLVGLTAVNTLGLLTPTSTVGANTIPIGGVGGAIVWSGLQTFNAGASAASGQFINALTDGSTGGFRAGASSDVLLYRYDADIWRTPDSFYVGGAIQSGIASAGVSSALRLQANIAGIEYIQAGQSTTDGAAALVICRYGTTNTAILAFNVYAETAIISGELTVNILRATATANQLVLQSNGVTGTLTWTPATSNKVITLPNATGTAALGTGTATRVAFWSDANTLTSDADMTFVTDTLTVAKVNASTSLAVAGGTAYTSISNAPGAAAAILASTVAGALTLEGLTVNGLVTITVTDAVTAAASDVLIYSHNSTGTPASGFGANMRLNLESDTTPDQPAGLIQSFWGVATHASRKAVLRMMTYDTTAREGFRIYTDGAQALIGFLGAAAVARPAAYTQTYSTTSRTHTQTAMTDPAAYGAGANGYSTGAMASAIHAEVIALRANMIVVQNVLNQVIDDLQAFGLLA